jgi:hypothetical protein
MKNTSIAIGLGISAITGILLQSAPATAANFSFSGNLANPNARPTFNFVSDGTSTVTIQSYSYGGGTNAAGNTILGGGFDLNLALFDAAGNGVDESDDIGGTGKNNLDFSYTPNNPTKTLPSGTYQAIIFANGNYPNGAYPGGKLSDGFTNTGDFFGRNSAYAFDILNVTSASTAATAVPEPFTIVGTLIGGTAALKMRKRLKITNKL